MRPHIETMRVNIARALSIDVDCVSVKATTEEGLGFTGHGEGIAAQAICLLTTPQDVFSSDVLCQAGGGCAGCGKGSAGGAQSDGAPYDGAPSDGAPSCCRR